MNIRHTTWQLWRAMLLAAAAILSFTLMLEIALAQAKGSYLGMKPPGMTPVIFAPGIVSTDAHEFSVSINSDATEIYFSQGTGPNNIKQIISWAAHVPVCPA